jgi:flagellar hook-basal body complex protein FliE
MSSPISSLGPLTSLQVTPLDPGSKSASGFGSILTDAMQKVESLGDDATKSVENFLSGEGDDLHKTIMTTQRADLAMELFLQVRNKVVSAYQEVMRMQV